MLPAAIAQPWKSTEHHGIQIVFDKSRFLVSKARAKPWIFGFAGGENPSVGHHNTLEEEHNTTGEESGGLKLRRRKGIGFGLKKPRRAGTDSRSREREERR